MSSAAPGDTIIDRATAIVRERIMCGRYSPGQRLVEAQLNHDLKISRGSVRTMLRRLEGDGLVVIEAYRGAIVAPLSRESLQRAFEVREAIEGLAARLAAIRFDKGEVPRAATERRLREWAKTGSAAKSSYADRNARFHNYIAVLSGNTHLVPILNQMQLPAQRSHFPLVLDRVAMDTSFKEHMEIVTAICRGAASRAENAMRRHVRRTAKLSQKLPDYLFPGSIDS